MVAIRRAAPLTAAAVFWLASSAAAFQRAEGPLLLEHEVLVSPVELAADPTVQQELHIDPATQKKITELAEKMRQESGGVLRERGLFAGAKSTLLMNIRNDAEEKLYKLLDKDQRARLEQLRIQQDGYFALLRPEVAEGFDLSEGQGPMLRQGAREMYRHQQLLLIDAKYEKVELDPDQIRKRMVEIRKFYNGKIDGVLTAKQKALWNQLAGKPLPLVLEPLKYATEPLEKVKELVDSHEALLLDVRDETDWNDGHVEGAISIPYSDLSSRDSRAKTLRKLLLNVPKDQIVFCYSSDGWKALLTASNMRDLSYDARALKPGYLELVKAGFAPSK